MTEEHAAHLHHFIGWLNGMGYAIEDLTAPGTPPSAAELIDRYLDADTSADEAGQAEAFDNGYREGQRQRRNHR